MGQPAMLLAHFKLRRCCQHSVSNYEKTSATACVPKWILNSTKQALRKRAGEKITLYNEGSQRQLDADFAHPAFILLVFGRCSWFTNRLQLKTLTLQKRASAEYEQKALHLRWIRISCSIVCPISSFLSARNGKLIQLIKYLSWSSPSWCDWCSNIPKNRSSRLIRKLKARRITSNWNNCVSTTCLVSTSIKAAIEDDMALPSAIVAAASLRKMPLSTAWIPGRKAGHIAIDFPSAAISLVITITDNGIGIDKSQECWWKSGECPCRGMALDTWEKRLEMMEAYTLQNGTGSITKETKNENGEATGTKVVLCICRYSAISWKIKLWLQHCW